MIRILPNSDPEVRRAVGRHWRDFPWWVHDYGCWQGLDDAGRAEFERNMRDLDAPYEVVA